MLMGLGHVGRQMIAAKRRLYIEPAALDLSFMTPGSLDGRITFARAGTATYFDSSGNMQVAAANAPRWDYNPSTLVLNGLLIEESRTNIIKNSMLTGAVPGTPGTDPTGWTAAPLAGLTKTIVGTGTEHGIAYVDYRYQGSVATPNQHIYACGGTPSTAFPAVGNQVYVSSLYLSFVAGSLTGLISISLLMSQTDSGGVSLGTQGGPSFTIGSNYFPTIGDPLIKIRPTVLTYAATPATTAFIQPFYRIGLATSTPIDFTVRIGAPQFEPCAAGVRFNTSYIPTTVGPVTRQDDSATMSTSPWLTSPSAFSYSVEATQAVAGQAPIYMQMDDGTIANMTQLSSDVGQTNVRFYQDYNSGVTANVGLGAFAVGTPFKAAASTITGAHQGTLNGGTLGSSSVANPPPTGMITARFGRSTTGVQGVQWLRRARVWNRALSGAELQSVTT